MGTLHLFIAFARFSALSRFSVYGKKSTKRVFLTQKSERLTLAGIMMLIGPSFVPHSSATAAVPTSSRPDPPITPTPIQVARTRKSPADIWWRLDRNSKHHPQTTVINDTPIRTSLLISSSFRKYGIFVSNRGLTFEPLKFVPTIKKIKKGVFDYLIMVVADWSLVVPQQCRGTKVTVWARPALSFNLTKVSTVLLLRI